MANIHELREDYRHYRMQNPQYRLLFLLGDLLSVLAKLAALAFIVYALWYLLGRSEVPAGSKVIAEVPTASRNTTIAAQTNDVQNTRNTAKRTPALTRERIELLKKIAGEPLVEESVETPVVVTVQSAQAESPYANGDDGESSVFVYPGR